jgi:chromate reductase
VDTSIHLIGISGSLRKDSLNTSLLHAAKELLPEGVTLEIISIADIPFYNGDQDLPMAQERPDGVKKFRERIAAADGIVIASPEYNYSVPGVLKNAVDWASRGEDSPIRNKPVALMGASPGLWGTVRMQLAFLPIFLTLGMKVAEKPEVLVAQANKKFDESGKLTDEITRGLIAKKLAALKDIILANKK